jgi:adenosylhomocysteine nucleosidase
VSALRRELKGLERTPRLRLSPPAPAHAALRAGAGEIVLFSCGIGAERAAAGTEALLRAVPVDFVLAVGFAGGLDAGLKTGDVVVASEVLAAAPPLGEGSEVFEPDARLLDAARRLRLKGIELRSGRLVTVRRVVSTAAEKLRLGASLGALAVDTESAAIARAARAAGTPLLCARAVLDEATLDLDLDFDRFLRADGRVRPLALANGILRRPRVIAKLLGLRRRSVAAAASLAGFLDAILGEIFG